MLLRTVAGHGREKFYLNAIAGSIKTKSRPKRQFFEQRSPVGRSSDKKRLCFLSFAFLCAVSQHGNRSILSVKLVEDPRSDSAEDSGCSCQQF